MSELPWCPGSGCTGCGENCDALLEALADAVNNGKADTGKSGDEMHGVVPCPRCGRPVEIWASREWTFDCSKGEKWTETPTDEAGQTGRGRGET